MCKYCEELDKNGEGPDICHDDSWNDRFHLWKDDDRKYRIHSCGSMPDTHTHDSTTYLLAFQALQESDVL